MKEKKVRTRSVPDDSRLRLKKFSRIFFTAWCITIVNYALMFGVFLLLALLGLAGTAADPSFPALIFGRVVGLIHIVSSIICFVFLIKTMQIQYPPGTTTANSLVYAVGFLLSVSGMAWFVQGIGYLLTLATALQAYVDSRNVLKAGG